MSKYRDLNHLDVLPASWTDAIQEFVSSTPNFRITVANATTIRGVAGASAAQAGLAVGGLWRWRTTNHDVAHVAGGAGQYDIYAIASANSFTNTPSVDTDITDYNWYLVSRVAGSPPTGNTPLGNPITQTMKVGETDWDGAAITAVRTTLGMNYSAQPINPIAPHAAFTPVRIRGAAGQTADLFRIEDSTGAALLRISSTGTFVGGLGAPTATTAAVDTNTTQVATTAFVIGQKGAANPLMDGTVAAGTSLRYASQDHVHPVDTSRAALTSANAFTSSQSFGAFAGTLLTTAQTAANAVLTQKLLAADANAAFSIGGDGKLSWGPGGATAPDTTLARVSANVLSVGGNNIVVASGATPVMVVTDFSAVAFIDVTIATTDRFCVIEFEIESSALAELRLAPNALATAIYGYIRDGSYETSAPTAGAVAAVGIGTLDNNGLRLGFQPQGAGSGGMGITGRAVIQTRITSGVGRRCCVCNAAVTSITGSGNHLIELQNIASVIQSTAAFTSLRFAISTGTMTGRVTVTRY